MLLVHAFQDGMRSLQEQSFPLVYTNNIWLILDSQVGAIKSQIIRLMLKQITRRKRTWVICIVDSE